MSSLGLQLPADIPWQRIGVAKHMMDAEVCDRKRPVTMQPSLAIFQYEPEPGLDGKVSPVRISYLKVTCSITTYGATNLDRLRNGDKMVTSPYNDFSGTTAYTERRADFDSSQRLTGADLPCFGALLEVSVGPPDSSRATLDEYPYFSDFEPKKRELYELISDTGEIMSRTLENAGVLHGGTTSSSNEVFDKDTLGVTGSIEYGAGDTKAKIGGSYASEEGSRSVDSAEVKNVRSVDASREARETFSHTTQLSQMYQLLTSFHLGTNRSVFFIEPRPHIVQRDRTLHDGPRQLEGIQEFFLVVVRPREMKTICVDASLETLHVGSIIAPEADDSPNTSEVRIDFPRIGQDGSWADPGTDRPYTAEFTYPYVAPSGWVIDRFRGTDGYLVNNLDQAGTATIQHLITPTDSTVTIWARVDEHHTEGGVFTKDVRKSGHFQMTLTIYLKRAVALAPATTQFAILTNTSVCTCPGRSMSDSKEKQGPSVVREFVLPTAQSVIGHPMEIGAAREWSKFFKSSVRSSMSSPDRYPRGAVDFWDLDVMKAPLASAAAQRKVGLSTIHELLEQEKLPVDQFDEITHSYLKRNDVRRMTMSELLRPGLREFVSSTGLDFRQAAQLRSALWEVASASHDKSEDQESGPEAPDLMGVGLNEVAAALAAASLGLGKISHREDAQPTGVVLEQSAAPGTRLRRGAQIDITVSTGLSVRLPNVVGLSLGLACCRLRDAGLVSDPELDVNQAQGKHLVVNAMEPPAGRYVTPNSRVTLRVGP